MRRAAALAGIALLALPAGAAPSRLDVAKVAGVYKYTAVNPQAYGGHSENILEIVQQGPAGAYLRVHAEFSNGHICAIHGLAQVEGDELILGRRAHSGANCALHVSFKDGRVLFTDKEGNCSRNNCGAFSSLENTQFATASRRAIRYLPRLLASREYKDALAEAAGK